MPPALAPTLKTPSTLSQGLPAEARWLTHLRWLAGLAVFLGAATHGLWSEWTGRHSAAMALGLGVISYNFLFWMIWRSRVRLQANGATQWLAAVQIALDMGVLTLLTLWTGGLTSPLLGLFVLHMVLGSLFLPPAPAYGIAVAAIAMMFGGLFLAGQWPAQEREAMLMAIGWSATLILTVFIAAHITTQLRQQEAARRNEHHKIRAILEAAVDAIITIDALGIITSANPAAERLFGYPLRELLGQNVSILMPEPFRGEHDGYLARYMTSGQARIIGIGRELTIQRKDGSIAPIELAVSEVPLDSGRMFTGIVRDISERKRTESELMALNDTLRRHQEAMIQHEKMAAMGQMAAGVAHEISNPLASMDSLLQLLQRQPARITPENIHVLRQQVERITHIVRELTAFAHPSGAGWSTIPLGDIVRGALDMVRFDHRIRHVTISCQCDDTEPVRVMPQSLQQVLVNLILNALDAVKDSPDPQLILKTHAPAAKDGWRTIEVTDTGHGIAPEHLSRIFEPFFTTKPVGKGTGLGLSISYSLIERHGGRFEVSSTPGKGTTFRIHLPAPQTLASAAAIAPLPAHCLREAPRNPIPEPGKTVN
jgi:two-component system, LuxR family, sensor kinase FixL